MHVPVTWDDGVYQAGVLSACRFVLSVQSFPAASLTAIPCHGLVCTVLVCNQWSMSWCHFSGPCWSIHSLLTCWDQHTNMQHKYCDPGPLSVCCQWMLSTDFMTQCPPLDPICCGNVGPQICTELVHPEWKCICCPAKIFTCVASNATCIVFVAQLLPDKQNPEY